MGMKETDVSKEKNIDDVQRIMIIMIAALAPSFMMGTYIFGVDVPILAGVCAASAVAFEFLYEKLLHKDITIFDYSAIVTGMIFAFSLPANFPLWMAVIGIFIAIVPVKLLLGRTAGIKVNPALTARIAVSFIFVKQMTSWPLMDFVKTSGDEIDDQIGATALDLLADGGDLPGLVRLFIGFTGGPCGAVSVIAVLIGGAYLIWKKVISPVIPICTLGAMFAFAFIYYSVNGGPESPVHMALFHILAEGAVFSAFFCATDSATSPSGLKAKALFAVAVGVITMLLRLFGPYQGALSIAIVAMNLAAPFLDKLEAADQENTEQ